MAADLLKLDLYAILNVAPDATEKEIIQGYRKGARKCHPDKNPDNPKAAELFHQLSKALEVLTDAATRASYDKAIKAKKQAEVRHRELDSKRKKFKEDLDSREKAAESRKENDIAEARKLDEEINRLRKEGSRLLEEEKNKLEQELKEEKKRVHSSSSESTCGARLKVKWKAKKGDETNGGYSKEYLQKLFEKYGEVTGLIISTKKNGAGIVEFSSSHSAVLAIQNEIGIPTNPLSLSWLSGQPAAGSECGKQEIGKQKEPTTTFPSFAFQNTTDDNPTQHIPSERDFESLVLMKMRQAEERKRLIAQMTEDDEET